MRKLHQQKKGNITFKKMRVFTKDDYTLRFHLKIKVYPSIYIKRKCQDCKVSFKGSSIASY